MTKAGIFDGDIVVCALGLIREEGIYVFDLAGERFVKRLQFDPFEGKINIFSENERYPTVKTIPADSQGFRIVGKVVWKGGEWRY